MHKHKRLFLLLVTLLLVSCGQPGSDDVGPATDITHESGTSTPNPATPTSTATQVPAQKRPRYEVSAELDYEAKVVSVEETVTYQNNTGTALSNLVFAVEPNLWWQCFFLESLTVNGDINDEYMLDGQRLEIALDEDLAPADDITLKMVFDVRLPYIEIDDNEAIIRTQLFGYSFRQINLIDWFPLIVPYLPGGGWILNQQNPGGYGEHMVYESADFYITMRFKNAPDLIVAASGPEDITEDSRNYQLEGGRDFVLSISPDFLVEQREMQGVTISSYYFPGSENSGIAAAEITAQAMAVFNQLFEPYPHQSVSVVQNASAFAMEYDGLFFLNRQLYPANEALEMITVHETAHLWWFGLVGNDQAVEPWLDESMATYSERLYYEAQSPPRDDWWELTRLWENEPQYWLDTPVDAFGRIYRYAVYLDGAVFLHEIRERIGDEAFFSFLKAYTAAFTYRVATTQDFMDLLRTQSQTDISDIIDRYFHGTY